MTLSPVLRTRFWAAAFSIVAVVLGVQIAQQSLLWPCLVAGAFAAFALTRVQPIAISTLLIGSAIFGYVVGNRGFAQISITEHIPLLPAELVLCVAGTILIVRTAFKKAVPIRREFLNLTLLAWMTLSSLRIASDVNTFGVMAVRDFAMIYYAAFFYIVQDTCGTAASRRFLRGALLTAFGTLAIISPLYELFPGFFLEKLTFRAIPVIYLKGDLVGTFAAAGSLLFFSAFEGKRGNWSLLASLALAAIAMGSNNRASMVGLALGSLALLLGGRWRFFAMMSGAAAAAVVIYLAVALARNEPWRDTPIYGAYEKVVSIADPTGQGNYSGKETSNKGDNNAFRWIWWRITIDETIRSNPWTGLGWGYDLAQTFEQIYYPEGNDEFAARSPHSIFVTVFARTGLLGFLPFLAFVGAILVRSVRAIRGGLESAYLWAAVLVILTSSAFGVVLEGPMGAVVFWTILGLASSYDVRKYEKLPDNAAPEPST